MGLRACGPTAGETDVAEMLCESGEGNEKKQRGKDYSPVLFVDHFSGNGEDVAGAFPVAAGFTVEAAVTGTQAGKEFGGVGCSGNFSIGGAGGAQGVCIAAGGGGAAEAGGEARSLEVAGGKHVSIEGFEGRKIFFEPEEIIGAASAGEAGEDVVDSEEDSALGEIHEEGDEVVAAALDLGVVTGADEIHAEVDERATWQTASDLLAGEEIGEMAELRGGANGIMVGDGYEVHADGFEAAINVGGRRVTFAAETAEEGHIAHARVGRVDMEVALHTPFIRGGSLQLDDMRAKIA